MALLKKAGLSNGEIIKAATINPARFLSDQQDPPFGVIKIGKQADLVLVKGNPLDDLNALSNITKVIVRGKLLKRHAMPNQ